MDYTTTILSDSRGRFLQTELHHLSGLHVPVIHKSGAGFARLGRELNYLTRWHNVSTLYILAGINETTWKDPISGRVFAIHNTPEDLCDDITDGIERLIWHAYANCGVQNVVFIPIVGIDLARYNGDDHVNPQQQIIDQGLRLVNDNIIAINAAHNLHTPMLHQHIVKSMGHGKWKIMYSRLYDGLHPRWDTLERWAGGLLRAMSLNGDI